MIHRHRAVLVGAVVCLFVLSSLYLMFSGSLAMTPGQVMDSLFHPEAGSLGETVIWQLRLPRLAAGLVAGFGLGCVGAVFQTLLRNPLAEPYVMGVSSGAGVGGVLVLAGGLAGVAGGVLMSGGGIVGGALALVLVFGLSGWFKRPDVVRLLLSGVVVGAMLGSLVTLVLLFGGKDTNVVMRWMLGSLTPMHWQRVGVMTLFVGMAFGIGWRDSRALNAFAFSEELAGRLGVDSRRVMVRHLVLGTGAIGAMVGSVGIIGFVGLVAPHIARSLVGPDLRRCLGLSGVVGALVLVMADFLAQKVLPGGELPVGAVTAVLGAPVLLVLLRRSVYRV
ncbi:MAG: FecCD family ABC transporter permease [Fimbriimonadaceae bacterium]